MCARRKKSAKNKLLVPAFKPADIEAAKGLGKALVDRVPTDPELRHLATLLLQGRGIPSKPEMQAAAHAILELTTICHVARDARVRVVAMAHQHLIDRMENAKQLPDPKSYPVPLEKFLSLLMPGKKPANRRDIFIKIIEAALASDFGHIPNPSDVETVFSRLAVGLDRPHYEIWGLAIKRLLPVITAKANKDRARRAVEARWAKNKTKNSIDSKIQLKFRPKKPNPLPQHLKHLPEYPVLPSE